MTDASHLADDVVDEIRGLLAERRRDAAARLATLTGRFQEVVEASAGSNADDEHDPEGATIAFERSQVDALARRAEADLAEVADAERRLADVTYGTCTVCGSPVPVERLLARPTARTCVTCAART